MYSKVGLILLFSLMGSCVRGEFECKEYPLKQNDPFSPARTVRVCGAKDYEDIPKLLRTLLGIEKRNVEKPTQYLLPPFEESADTPKLSNGFSQNLVTPSGQSSHLPKYDESKQQQNQNLDAITADLRTVKQSVDELKSQLKDISNNVLAHKIEERKVNIVLSLDAVMEALAKRMLQLAEGDRQKDKETDPTKFFLNAIFASQSKANSAAVEVKDDDDDDNEDEKVYKDISGNPSTPSSAVFKINDLNSADDQNDDKLDSLLDSIFVQSEINSLDVEDDNDDVI